ncbi:MAG: hypothetical protein KatS3mg102_1503 [Planctomycetota bacterium]|nr:MAG: hypothetical protein KatS3mg102_1503 [Planctomycetota bacterium]
MQTSGVGVVPQPQAPRRPTLAYVASGGQVRYVSLGDEPLLLGRSPAADVPLREPTVSLRHARIEPDGRGGHVLVDCGSRNGTFVNGQRIERHPLRSGDKVAIGGTVFLYLDRAPHGAGGRPALESEPRLLRHGSTTTIGISPQQLEDELSEPGTVLAGEQPGPGLAQQRLHALFQLGSRLNRLRDEAAFVQAMCGLLQELFSGCRLAITLGEDEQADEQPRAAVVPEGQPDFAHEPPLMELCGEARARRMTLLSLPPPLLAATPEDEPAGALLASGERVPSAIAAPLLEDERVVGLLYVEARPPLPALSSDEMRLVATLAAQASVILSNIRLHAASARANAELERARAQLEQANRELERRVEERTREIERLADVVTHATDAIVVMDAEGRVQVWNDAARALFGYTAEQARGRLLRELVTRPELPAGAQPWLELERRGAAQGAEAVWSAADGTPLEVQVALFPVGREPGRGLAAIVRDMRERNRLHEELTRAAKLAAVGALSAEIAHQFNNYLAGILGNAELLELEELGEDARASVSAILESGRRARRAIADLLAFSRESRGTGEPVALHGIIERALRLVERRLFVAGLRLVREVRREATVRGEAGRLVLMLLNFLTNAADATPRGGEVGVSLDVEGEWAVLQVWDSGVGMEESVRQRIFEPYFTTKGGEHGRGLGLAIAHEIVKWHGGRIAVASAPGRGTRITVQLPLETGAASEPAPAPPPASGEEGGAARSAGPAPPPAPPVVSPGQALRVLVVDDEADVRAAMAAMVRKLGHHAAALASAEAALEHLEREPADLVVSDYAMPGRTGLDLLRELRRRGLDIPFILVTGHAPPQAARLRELGAQELLRKPFAFAELAAALERARSARAGGDGPAAAHTAAPAG